MHLLGSQQKLKQFADSTYAAAVLSPNEVLISSETSWTWPGLGLVFFPTSCLSPIQMLETSIHRYGEHST